LPHDGRRRQHLIRGARVFHGQRLREASSARAAGGIIADLTATLLAA
jgi:hypothetical protein